jgi:hypothetical protein
MARDNLTMPYINRILHDNPRACTYGDLAFINSTRKTHQ